MAIGQRPTGQRPTGQRPTGQRSYKDNLRRLEPFVKKYGVPQKTPTDLGQGRSMMTPPLIFRIIGKVLRWLFIELPNLTRDRRQEN